MRATRYSLYRDLIYIIKHLNAIYRREVHKKTVRDLDHTLGSLSLLTVKLT